MVFLLCKDNDKGCGELIGDRGGLDTGKVMTAAGSVFIERFGV